MQQQKYNKKINKQKKKRKKKSKKKRKKHKKKKKKKITTTKLFTLINSRYYTKYSRVTEIIIQLYNYLPLLI